MKTALAVKAGKDADVVVWSADPLSVYAVCEKTFVDGVAYWDYSKDAENREKMHAEEARIIQKMIEAKTGGATTQRPTQARRRGYTCDSVEDQNFVIADDYTDMQKARQAASEKSDDNNIKN